MAIPHSKAMPTHIRVGLSVTIFFFQRYSEQKKGFPLLSLLQSDQKIRTITSHKYVLHIHHRKPIREQL